MLLTIQNECPWVIKDVWFHPILLINLYPNEYSKEFHYYPFSVKLDRCAGSCNTINDLSNKRCVAISTEDLNLKPILN